MLFYQGDNPRIIAVYDSSHQFNNYITQAYDRLTAKPFTHYVFVADDMIVRQDLNENNILHELRLDKDSAYIPFIKLIDNKSFFTWPWSLKQVGKLNYPAKASEFRKYIPDLTIARKHSEKNGIDWRQGYTRSVLPCAISSAISPFPMDSACSYFRFALLALRFKISRSLGTLSDRKFSWAQFIANYATRIAGKNGDPEYPLQRPSHGGGGLPTAMAFTVDHIVQAEESGGFDSRNEGMPEEIFERDQGSLASLIQNWREGVLFYHPVKLSQWKSGI